MSPVLGIDLGTTNSLVAFMDGDEPRIIPNSRGNRWTPTVVAFRPDGEILVGDAARNQALLHPDATFDGIKLLLGGETTLPVKDRLWRPEELCALVLARLVQDAADYLGEKPGQTVITVPAHFRERQRRGVQVAAQMAGLEVLRLLNEPTAAALAMAWREQGSREVVVYDLGGGTFDVSCLAAHDGSFRVRSSAGDGNLGGRDFDHRLLEILKPELVAALGSDVLERREVMQKLHEQAEQAKIELSVREHAEICLPFAGAGNSHFSRMLSREEFESTISPLVERTIELTATAIQEAGLARVDFDRMVLSGGSSRIPLVQKRLAQEFGVSFDRKVNPEELVALGAAVYTTMLSSQGGKSLVERTAFSLGVEADGGISIPLIPKNTAMPTQKQRVFTTVVDQQESVEIHILQGESDKSAENVSLGRFLLDGIDAMPKGEPRIEVCFAIDEDGLLNVSARDEHSKRGNGITVVPLQFGQQGLDFEEAAARTKALLDRARELADTQKKPLVSLRQELEEAERMMREAVRNKSLEQMKLAAEIAGVVIAELSERLRMHEVDHE